MIHFILSLLISCSMAQQSVESFKVTIKHSEIEVVRPPTQQGHVNVNVKNGTNIRVFAKIESDLAVLKRFALAPNEETNFTFELKHKHLFLMSLSPALPGKELSFLDKKE